MIDPFRTQYDRDRSLDGSDGRQHVVKNVSGSEWELPGGTQAHGLQPRAVRVLHDVSVVRWMAAIIVLVLAIFVGRLFSLQIVQGSTYREAADNNRYRLIVDRAPRGEIVDIRGQVIATNAPVFDVVAVPVDLPEADSDAWNALVQRLSSIVQREPSYIQEQLQALPKGSFSALAIVSDIPQEQAFALKAASLEVPGIDVQTRSRRVYENGEAFAHLLGYVGRISQEEYAQAQEQNQQYLLDDTIGKGGLESQYESLLRGVYGRRQVEVDSYGGLVHVAAQDAAVPGATLTLSIDAEFQQEAQRRLQATLDRFGSDAGAVVAMDPMTGRILALVSAPTFDPNLFVEGISQEQYSDLANDPQRPLFHRAVMGQYPPGSTVKPMLAAAAMDEGIITPQTTIIDEGVIQVPNQYDPSIVYEYVGYERRPLGPVNIYSAIARSSDIFFYYIAGGFGDFTGLGAHRLASAYTRFGMGSPLGIDLPSEASGRIPTPAWNQERFGREWLLGDSYNMGIGQGNVLTTPLQVTSWTATLANGGTVYSPQILYKTTDPATGVTVETAPRILHEGVVSPAASEAVRKGMRDAVINRGSAYALKDAPYNPAGKTGTAQYANNTKVHAWFTSYAPYEQPEIAMTVLVEDGIEGAVTAVPLTKELYDWWFAHRQ